VQLLGRSIASAKMYRVNKIRFFYVQWVATVFVRFMAYELSLFMVYY